MSRAVLFLLLWAGFLGSEALAQGVRITGTTTARYIQLRPLVEDSVAVETTVGEGQLRLTADGAVVRCNAGEAYCYLRRPGAAAGLVPLTQDLELNAWGFGRGVRVHAQLRGRAAVGDAASIWPRAEEPMDLLTAYVELERGRYRARAGRLWKVSGLGYYNYDGASFVVRPRADLSAELYGGWALATGLNEPRTGGALAAVEEFAPGRRDHLLGAELRFRPSPRTALTALYQREIRTDRGALTSERVAASGRALLGTASLEAGLDADLASRVVNDARLGVALPVGAAWTVRLDARRYRPFFELWTIWGAFSPVGFSEARASVGWRSGDDAWSLRVGGARRRYQEAFTGLSFAPLRSDGWRAEADAGWRPAPGWLVQGAYRTDIGFGAATSDGSLGVQRELGSAFVAVTGTAFQSVYEFRVGRGTVLGAGGTGGIRLGPEAQLVADLGYYHHLGRDLPAAADWSQVRASVRMDWTVGADPGLRAREEARR